MTPSQIIMQICLTIVQAFAVVSVVIGFRANYKPWQKGVPGLGGAVYVLGYYLNLANGHGINFGPGYRWDLVTIYVGVVLLILPALWMMIAEVWHLRPEWLMRNSTSVLEVVEPAVIEETLAESGANLPDLIDPTVINPTVINPGKIEPEKKVQ